MRLGLADSQGGLKLIEKLFKVLDYQILLIINAHIYPFI